MDVKIVFFVEGVQSADRYASAALGWTETFYGSSTTIGTLDDWLDAIDVDSYIALRRRILPPIYRIAWVRVSDEANPRSFKLRGPKAAFGTWNSPSGIPPGYGGQATCALLVDLARLPQGLSDHTHHRKLLLRAIPADIINNNVINDNAASWADLANYLNWLAFHQSGEGGPGPGRVGGRLQNATIGLRFQDPLFQAFTGLPATQLDPSDTKGISVAGTLPGVLGTQILIRDAPDNVRALNRTWKVRNFVAGPPAVTLLGEARRSLPESLTYTPPGPAKYRVVSPKYGLFDQYTIIGLRTKKTGRLFRQLRGRSGNR